MKRAPFLVVAALCGMAILIPLRADADSKPSKAWCQQQIDRCKDAQAKWEPVVRAYDKQCPSFAQTPPACRKLYLEQKALGDHAEAMCVALRDC